MNYKKIGEYIANKRKENNLTQQELADKMHVSVKAISKWECGKGIPEISNLQILAKNLDVSIIDILNGKDSKKEDVVVEYVKKENKKKNTKIWFLTCLILLLVILFAFGLYFVNNYNKIYAYRLSGESEHFSFDSGFVLASNYNNIISTGNLKFKDKEYANKADLISIDLKLNDNKVLGSNALIGRTYLNIEQNGYENLLKDKIDKDSKWEIIINYVYDNQIVSEKIELNQELIFKNNRIINVKTEKLSDEEAEYTDTDFSYAIKLRDYLIKEKGFKEYEDTISIVYKLEKNNSGRIIKSTNINVFGTYSSIYLVDEFVVRLKNDFVIFPYGKLDRNKFIHIEGQYDNYNDKKDVLTLSKVDFGITYYYEKDEAVCNNGKCPENIYEISKLVYADYLEIKEYVEKEVNL